MKFNKILFIGVLLINLLCSKVAFSKEANVILIGDNFSCEKYGHESGVVNGCKLNHGATLDQVISDLVAYAEKTQLMHQHCGEYGVWVLDKNGNIMYRVKNPDCPIVSKPIGYGNYCDLDLFEIGQGNLPKSARPRVLWCK